MGDLGGSAGMRMALRETERASPPYHTMPLIMGHLHSGWSPS